MKVNALSMVDGTKFVASNGNGRKVVLLHHMLLCETNLIGHHSLAPMVKHAEKHNTSRLVPQLKNNKILFERICNATVIVRL